MWLLIDLDLFSLVTVGIFEMGVVEGNWEVKVIQLGLMRWSGVIGELGGAGATASTVVKRLARWGRRITLTFLGGLLRMTVCTGL